MAAGTGHIRKGILCPFPFLFRNPLLFFKNFFGIECVSYSVLTGNINPSEEKGHPAQAVKRKLPAGGMVGSEKNNGYFTF